MSRSKYSELRDTQLTRRGDAVLAKSDADLVLWAIVCAGFNWDHKKQAFTLGEAIFFCETAPDGSPIIPAVLRAKLRELYIYHLDDKGLTSV